MKKNLLYTAWVVLYILCAALGFLPERSGALQVFLSLLSLVFFLPPALLLRQGKQAGDKKTVSLVRTVSLTSLGLTLLMLIFNIIFAARTAAVGNALHALLVLVSAPMMTAGAWVVSLFLWACLLVASIYKK